MPSFRLCAIFSILSIFPNAYANNNIADFDYENIIYETEPTEESRNNNRITMQGKQTMEGFGATVAFQISSLLDHEHVEELSTILFKDLNLEMLRIRNCYMSDDSGSDTSYETDMMNTASVIEMAETALDHDVKILISSWTAPNELKTTSGPNGGTISYDPENIMDYHYREYAIWWMESLQHYHGLGIVPEFISIQNEPNKDDDTSPSMKLEPSQLKENAIAGYNMALEAVAQYMDVNGMDNIPNFIGPDTSGFLNDDDNDVPMHVQIYIDNLVFSRTMYAWSHHLYENDIGTNPDALNDEMTHFATINNQKPIFMTEYYSVDSATPWLRMWNYAKVMHNSLTVEGVSAFFHKSLYGDGEDALVVLSDDTSYEISPEYYALRHYSGFINHNAVRVETSIEEDGVFLSAFADEERGKLTVVVLNENADKTMLEIDFDGLSIMDGEFYQSTKEKMNCEKVGDYASTEGNNVLELEGESITTFVLEFVSPYGVIPETGMYGEFGSF